MKVMLIYNFFKISTNFLNCFSILAFTNILQKWDNGFIWWERYIIFLLLFFHKLTCRFGFLTLLSLIFISPMSFNSFFLLKVTTFPCPFKFCTDCLGNILAGEDYEVWCYTTWYIWVSRILLCVAIKSNLDTNYFKTSLKYKF